MKHPHVPPGFSVEAGSEPFGGVMHLRGEFDLAASALFDEVVHAMLSGAPQLLLVDLRDLEFIDSTGLNCLIIAKARAEEAGVRFVLTAGEGAALSLLRAASADDLFEVIADPGQLDTAESQRTGFVQDDDDSSHL